MNTYESEKLMALTMGELMDMYSGWVWRHEREFQDSLVVAILNARSHGAEITLERLMQRPPYPILRSVETTTVGFRKRTQEELAEDWEDLKEIFKDELKDYKGPQPKQSKEEGMGDMAELWEEAMRGK